ncbi:GNAT family N-acetyltransferase [Microtetraspora sp. AC03309]|uniref:GNAT family N-acetyltransferase n=1 Tax=Microtetraspora sp. AC03309 TaxID=2779376 RepID=UPI001E3CA494|nr:GNAT family N-acetyltransferase [Microtetraspora sp. AC03309]MCC5575733.1 GNAT family N-acetyltransferase [Microtetraspora sp. AC03309]
MLTPGTYNIVALLDGRTVGMACGLPGDSGACELRSVWVSPRARGRSIGDRLYAAGGRQALASKGPGGAVCKLTDAQLAVLEAELEAGPAAYGWQDQCWTLSRIAEVVKARFGVSYTLGGMCYLLHRLGWSWQAPARRAAERDEAAIAGWRDEQWPVIKGPRPSWEPGCASKTRPVKA